MRSLCGSGTRFQWRKKKTHSSDSSELYIKCIVHQLNDVRDGVRTHKIGRNFKRRVLKSFEASRKFEIASGHAVWERQAGPLTGFDDSGSCAPLPRRSCERAPPAAAPEAAAASRKCLLVLCPWRPTAAPRCAAVLRSGVVIIKLVKKRSHSLVNYFIPPRLPRGKRRF